MAGVKGRSGRKSTTDEQKRLRIIDKAWNIVEQALDDPRLSKHHKFDIAKAIALRSMPEVHEGLPPLLPPTINFIAVEPKTTNILISNTVEAGSKGNGDGCSDTEKSVVRITAHE